MPQVPQIDYHAALEACKKRFKGIVDFMEAANAGDPDALAAMAFWDTPEGRARAKEAYTSAIETWKAFRAE